MLISENEKLKKDNVRVVKESDKLRSENKKLYSLNEDFELTKNSLYKSKLKNKSLGSQLKIEKTKLSSILFINSIGKKLINLGLPFFKVDRFLEVLQGGIFFSRLADKKEIESTGFLLIFLIFIIGIYELLKKLLKKFFKSRKNNSPVIKQVGFEEIY